MTDAAAHVATAVQLACLLEVSAAKPGNVSPDTPFGDTTYQQFLASAAAIGPALGTAAERSIGDTVLRAITDTRRWTNTNTNLGIVLLLAPLARAARVCLAERPAGQYRVTPVELRRALGDVLAATTVEDARAVYAAIRLASPGGLGAAPEQDVANEPTIALTDAMRLAAERDGIAREYASDFQTTFESAVPALQSARRDGVAWNDAVVETFLTVLAASPDTHIARRAGIGEADRVTSLARAVMADGGIRTDLGRESIARMSTSLRDAANRQNPGTTADIVAAAIFVVLLDGGWPAANGFGGHDAPSR